VRAALLGEEEKLARRSARRCSAGAQESVIDSDTFQGEEVALTLDGSEGTSPCRLSTISTSCIASNTG
jgi:hypothetical protein